MRTATCLHCGQPLHFTARIERANVSTTVSAAWRHAGDGVYMMHCPHCHWRGAPHPSPVRCPQCNSTSLRDDHHARPLLGTDSEDEVL